MALTRISMAEAKTAPGLRMVVVGGVPSPWGEAAKGLFHIKGIDWRAVDLVQDDPEMRAWIGGSSAPVVFFEDEPPIDDALDIVRLAERIAPTPALLPDPFAEDILAMIGELTRPGGLGWERRLQFTHWSLIGDEGYPTPIAQYLGAKYGHSPEAGDASTGKVVAMLGALADRLRAGGDYYFGDALTAADVYSATFMALFDPLPPELCDMRQKTRDVFGWLDDATRTALDPILLAHRDRVYRDHLASPLSL